MTWFINDLWLREFANKISIGVGHYLIGIAIMVVLGLALLVRKPSGPHAPIRWMH